MNPTQALEPNAGSAGIASATLQHRSKTVVLRNSRIYCGVVMFLGVCAAFIGVCMMLMIISLLTPFSAVGFMRVMGALQWGLGGVCMVMLCPALWKWGLRLAFKRVTLGQSTVEFRLGTKKAPIDLAMDWEEVAGVQQKRVGNTRQFTVTGKDGSYATFTSTTFLRAGHIARKIAERAGLTVQQG